MDTTGIDALREECKRLLALRQEESLRAEAAAIATKAEVRRLERVLRSIEDAEGPPPRIKGQRGQGGRVGRIVAILQASDKPLHIGAICKALGDEDNNRNRTRVTAAIGHLLKGPGALIERVAVGVYTSKESVQ